MTDACCDSLIGRLPRTKYVTASQTVQPRMEYCSYTPVRAGANVQQIRTDKTAVGLRQYQSINLITFIPPLAIRAVNECTPAEKEVIGLYIELSKGYASSRYLAKKLAIDEWHILRHMSGTDLFRRSYIRTSDGRELYRLAKPFGLFVDLWRAFCFCNFLIYQKR